MFEKIILTRLHLYPCCVIKACVREVTAQNHYVWVGGKDYDQIRLINEHFIKKNRFECLELQTNPTGPVSNYIEPLSRLS